MDYEKVSEKEWEEMVRRSDNAYFFSSPQWAKILEKSFDEYRTATRLYQVNGKSILIPMMVKNSHGRKAYGFKSFESMPDEGLGGMFSESEVTTDEFQSIVQDIIGRRHTFYIAIPPFESISPGISTIKEEWNLKDMWNYIHLLELEGRDFEHIWKNYNKKTRGSIRKAIKSGVEIREATSLDDFRAFYNIWSPASQKWEHQETYSFKFFHNLYKYGSPHVKLTLATKDDQIIAGLISFHYTKTVYLFYGAAMKEYRTFNPTSLLINYIIEKACQEGDYKSINFGHSMQLEGLKKFKEGFRAEEVEIEKYFARSKGAEGGAQILNKYKTLMDRVTS